MDSLTLATWALVIVTAVYVVLTGRITMQNARLIERQSRPELVVFLEVNENHAVFLVLQNVGAGVARNVRVNAPAEWMASEQLGALGRIGFIARGVSTLPAGARLHSLIAVFAGTDIEALAPIPIDLEYQDAGGKRIAAHFVLDVRELHHIRPGGHVRPGSIIS